MQKREENDNTLRGGITERKECVLVPASGLRKESASDSVSGLRKENVSDPVSGLRKENASDLVSSLRKECVSDPVYGLGRQNVLNRQPVRTVLEKIYKNMHIRAAGAVLCALVWCGLLYPELCFTQGTCEQILIVQGQEIVIEQLENAGILNASDGQIIVRSRFLEWLEQLKSKK